MTPTILTLFGRRYWIRSEKDAFVCAVEVFLTVEFKLFTDLKNIHVCKGRRGASLFAAIPDGMHQPVRLSNGWWAETCLSNDQKVRILDTLAQCVGARRGTDWDWQADSRPTRSFIDGEALLAEFAQFA